MTNKTAPEDFKDFAMEAAMLEAQQKRQSHGRPGHNEPFPVQLHWMLEQAEKEEISHIVRWSPHGRAFVVHKRDIFVEKVLPVYFSQSKFTSFQRQLSLYGFKRLSKGTDRGGYYHPMFLRISRTFARNIVRTKVKNEGPRKAAAPEMEPDFYMMSELADAISRADSMSEDRATGTGKTSPSQSSYPVGSQQQQQPQQQQQQLPPITIGNQILAGTFGATLSSVSGSPNTLANVPAGASLQVQRIDSNLPQFQFLLRHRREGMLRSLILQPQLMSMPNLLGMNDSEMFNALGAAVSHSNSNPELLRDVLLQTRLQNQLAAPAEQAIISAQLASTSTSQSQATEADSILSDAINQMLSQVNPPPPGYPPPWR